MKVIQAIFKRELGSYFGTPIAYVFIVIFVFLTGIFTFKLANFFEAGQADLRAFFFWHPWLYLFLVPAVSMRLWSEERKSGTIELLFTLPVHPWEAILGKFFAAWVFITIALLCTFPMVFTVAFLGDPDYGVILASYLGSLCMAGAYLSIGACFSAMTKNQIVSFILTVVACLSLILIGFPPFIKWMSGLLPAFIVEQIYSLSFASHFDAIQKGMFDLRDLLFFISLIFCGLYANFVILEEKRAT
jgi:ABC-2 type transport system permease protein